MLYKLLGMIVWNGGKRVLQRKYGATMAPPPCWRAGWSRVLARAWRSLLRGRSAD